MTKSDSFCKKQKKKTHFRKQTPYNRESSRRTSHNSTSSLILINQTHDAFEVPLMNWSTPFCLYWEIKGNSHLSCDELYILEITSLRCCLTDILLIQCTEAYGVRNVNVHYDCVSRNLCKCFLVKCSYNWGHNLFCSYVADFHFLWISQRG